MNKIGKKIKICSMCIFFSSYIIIKLATKSNDVEKPENYDLLKNNYYTEEFEVLENSYEEKFGPLIKWIIPKEELLEDFSEKVNISLEEDIDVLVKSYDNEKDFIYWKNIVDSIAFNEDTEEIGGNNTSEIFKLVKECVDTAELQMLENRYQNQFRGKILLITSIPKEETMSDLEQKIQICEVSGWDILPPDANY